MSTVPCPDPRIPATPIDVVSIVGTLAVVDVQTSHQGRPWCTVVVSTPFGLVGLVDVYPMVFATCGPVTVGALVAIQGRADDRSGTCRVIARTIVATRTGGELR
jgi:hypothetical protein